MFCFNDDRDADGMKNAHDRVGYLRGEIFLDLQAPSEEIDDARELGKANHFSVRDVGHMRLADERQQMVFAHGIKLDVFHEDDLARVGCEDRIVDQLIEVLSITLRQKLERSSRARRSFQEPFPRRIFADALEKIMIIGFDPLEIYISQLISAAAPGSFGFRIQVPSAYRELIKNQAAQGRPAAE